MIENTTLSTADLACLFSTTPKTVADLAKREIIVKGTKRGSWHECVTFPGQVMFGMAP